MPPRKKTKKVAAKAKKAPKKTAKKTSKKTAKKTASVKKEVFKDTRDLDKFFIQKSFNSRRNIGLMIIKKTIEVPLKDKITDKNIDPIKK